MSETESDYAVHGAMLKEENILQTYFRKRRKRMRLQTPAPIDWPFAVFGEFVLFLLQDSGKDDKERFVKFLIGKKRKNVFKISKIWLLDLISTRYLDSTIKLAELTAFRYSVHTYWKRTKQRKN